MTNTYQIYLISDSTGETLDRVFLAIKAQFRNIEYKVNSSHPLYDTMRKVVMKHLGLEDIVETVISKIGNVKQIVLLGDYAKGIDSGTIEVMLIGDNLNMDYTSQLEVKIEKIIKRKVTFYLSSKFLKNQKHIILYEA